VDCVFTRASRRAAFRAFQCTTLLFGRFGSKVVYESLCVMGAGTAAPIRGTQHKRAPWSIARAIKSDAIRIDFGSAFQI
jgi:hypothetical protein